MSTDFTEAIYDNSKDDAAWEAWFRHTYPKLVYLVARRNRVAAETAEEMAQGAIERFLRYRSYEKIRSDSAALAYLAMIASRLLIAEQRRSARELSTEPETLGNLPGENRPKPSEDQLSGFLKQLPQSDQEILGMYVNGYKTREISEKLGLNYSTAGMRILRAKNRLKKLVFSGE